MPLVILLFSLDVDFWMDENSASLEPFCSFALLLFALFELHAQHGFSHGA